MKFLSNDIASIREPSDEELEQYYKDHSDKYLTPYTYSLYQITFSPDKRTDNKNDASVTLQQFSDATFDEMKNWGDPLPFPYHYTDISDNELALQLGSKFPEAIKEEEVNKWIGPIPSGFGYHLVYITKKIEPQLPSMDVVKKDIIRDYEYDHQKEINELIYKELKKKYDIEITIKSEDFDPKFVEYLQEEMNE